MKDLIFFPVQLVSFGILQYDQTQYRSQSQTHTYMQADEYLHAISKTNKLFTFLHISVGLQLSVMLHLVILHCFPQLLDWGFLYCF